MSEIKAPEKKEWPIVYVRPQDMHEKSITRDKMPMISVGAVNHLKERITHLEQKCAELEKAVNEMANAKWVDHEDFNEYSKAVLREVLERYGKNDG